MPEFSFEFVRAKRPPLLVRTLDLDDLAAAWREVETLAFVVRNYSGASIRVKNAEGGIVILAGVSTALATFHRRRRVEDSQGATTSVWSGPAPAEA